MLAPLFNNIRGLQPCNFIKKKTPTQVFWCEYCKIFKDRFFDRTPVVTALILWTITILNPSRALENLRSMNDFNFTNFFSNRVIACSAKGASYCCFRKAVSKNLFQKFLLINFISFSISFLLAFCQGGCFLPIELWKVCSKPVIAPFTVRLKTATSRKSSWWISF